jgi:AraC-like DNA-binding protein
MVIVFPRHELARCVAGVRLAAAPTLGETAAPSNFVESVHQTVASLLQLGATELHVAAEAAGMSERSFQRHLGELGLTFSEVLEAARFEAARRMLADPAVRVIDVSTELGYSDSANFTRAFRRWTGVPPQVFRRTARLAPYSAGAR